MSDDVPAPFFLVLCLVASCILSGGPVVRRPDVVLLCPVMPRYVRLCSMMFGYVRLLNDIR